MAEKRFAVEYPVIGIRPVIDARKGPLDVRGSLEEQTMGMAKAAAEQAKADSIAAADGKVKKDKVAKAPTRRAATPKATTVKAEKPKKQKSASKSNVSKQKSTPARSSGGTLSVRRERR